MTIWRFVCEFPHCDREFDTLPDDHLSALGFFCDGHEEWMEENCAEQRARDPKILLEQTEIHEETGCFWYGSSDYPKLTSPLCI